MLCFIFAVLVVLLDQFFKRWIVITLASGGETVLIKGIISLIYVENTGASFSILANQRWLLAAIALVAAIIISFILLRYTEGFWGTLGLAAVLGGTVGNLIDRVFHGYVIDMFRTLFMNFAIFNIADIFITLGFITFCIHFISSSFKSTNREEPEPELAAAEQDEDPYSIYDIPENQELPDFSDLSDTRVIPDHDSVTTTEYYDAQPELSDSYEPALQQQDNYEPETQMSGDIKSALFALEELESEIGTIEAYDVDALLREYGFEDNETQV